MRSYWGAAWTILSFIHSLLSRTLLSASKRLSLDIQIEDDDNDSLMEAGQKTSLDVGGGALTVEEGVVP